MARSASWTSPGAAGIRSELSRLSPDHGRDGPASASCPGGRLASVLGRASSSRWSDTDTGRFGRSAQVRFSGGDLDSFTPGVSADGRLLAIPREHGRQHGRRRVVGASRVADTSASRSGSIARSMTSSSAPTGRRFTVVLDNPGQVGGVVETWDVRTRRRVRALQFPKTPSIARFSPNGKLLAIANRSGKTRVYEASTFKPVTPAARRRGGRDRRRGDHPGRPDAGDRERDRRGAAVGHPQRPGARRAAARRALERRDPRLHARRQPPRRDLRQRPRVRVGHPLLLARPPGPAAWPAAASRAPSGPSSSPDARTRPPADALLERGVERRVRRHRALEPAQRCHAGDR
jgi:hypothetical protein